MSRIFNRDRALGYVSNHIPATVRYIQRRKEHLISTCVGKAFHTYGCSHFSLLTVSGQHDEEITCIAGSKFNIFTADGCTVRAWKRGTELHHTYEGHSKPVYLLLPFGNHLISVDEESNLKVWDVASGDIYLELTFSNSSFQITALCHPDTYLNKILLGSEQGEMQLWNIKTSTLIYTFAGWKSSITVLEQAPAVDVIAIGLANGKIILHNLKFDESLTEFTQDWGLVTAISFRTDDTPIMATGSLAGHVVFWNIEERRVAGQLLSAHSGSVATVKCLPNEPLMVTSSPDNTLKLWIFDMPDGGARLLRIREGHSSPPTFIRFHGNLGHNIISAGSDSTLRIFHIFNQTFNKSLGKASYNRKLSKKLKKSIEAEELIMPPIVQFTSETTREKEWDDVAAIHRGLPIVTLWSYDKLKMSDLKLLPDSLKYEKTVKATSIFITHCGNFAVIGYSKGQVERFNIQSGIHRLTYGSPAHQGAVTGVAVDMLNQTVISGSCDGTIKFWNFKTSASKPITQLKNLENVMFFRCHGENSLLAVAHEDFTLSVLDVESRTIVRKFTGHHGQITDACFSPDSRWLISSAMDTKICVWDVPSGHLVDCFQVDAACTSLTMSPTGEYLATTHVDFLGIFLWANRTLFSHVTLRPIFNIDAVPTVGLPVPGVIDPDILDEENSPDDEYQSPDQISHLITLSDLASSRWQNLLDLDIIKKRNKPKEPPKAPAEAPFFLPTLPTVDLQFDLSDYRNLPKAERLGPWQKNSTVFGKLLVESEDSEDFQPAVEKLKSYSPSAVDLEISNLAPEGGGSIRLMLQFLLLINYMFKSRTDFEIAQTYLGVFIKKHGDLIPTEKSLREYLEPLLREQQSSWTSLSDKFMYCLCIVDHLKNK
ncbi:unnamed protein product [Bemisia tabaci]|uniref:WD repeat-containing protein 55 homolog n=1 Tax=Bemisia tabaci TaxID=7038 RepID=A0A9P0EWT5_BEMTA|nr:unnamed protein product [Bemisia tabaci]